MNWAYNEVARLPKVSYDYVFPYLNEIEKHPEIYEKKALFLDLVLTGMKDSLKINDDAVVFIRNQLQKNGTLDAIEQGKLYDFIIPEAKKENYDFARFVITSDKEKEQAYYANQIKSGLRTKDEKYVSCVNDDNNFGFELLSLYLKDENKTQEILDHYKKVRDKKLQNNDNPYAKAFRNSDVWYFAVEALGNGNKSVALEVIGDIAKHSVPEDIYENVPASTYMKKHRKLKYGKFSFLEHINDSYTEYGHIKELIKKNGIQKQVQQIISEYKERSDVDFHLNANLLSKARKKLAQKIDFHLGTDLERVKLPEVLKKAEKVGADIIYGKDKGNGY